MMMNARRRKQWAWSLGMVGLAGIPLVLSSCTEAPLPPSPAPAYGAAYEPVGDTEAKMRSVADSALAGSPDFVQRPIPPRPGLGTTWGEHVSSPMSYTGFERASSQPVQGVATIWYNDKAGVDAMTGRQYRTGDGMQRAAGGLVEWGIKSGLSTLRAYHWDGKRFVAGRDGARYSIVVKNHARSRLEVVLSVDGLDVVDGKPASVKKRGYIVWPGRTLEVEGWRSSEQGVASFRFSSVSNSYSSLKHGSTRNVGVVGLAVFTEKGIDPWNGYSAETGRRFSASPFAEAPMQRAQ